MRKNLIDDFEEEKNPKALYIYILDWWLKILMILRVLGFKRHLMTQWPKSRYWGGGVGY